MRYILRDKDGVVAARADDIKTEFSAFNWARDWLARHADQDRYRLETETGGRANSLIRTISGQWYVIPEAT
ncbi:hypothetical protein [Novosphingobium sp. JCM 18896]|uniref:hypothetical protein n=1 Tax=Novosphingobium sp. JCM 18896 TaxID=2989731 RepID=UPI002222CC81|nr:hypothetical protein [Novosphingobium sp. JCM 18896]MCW1432243.1 hypothetical protein [Novosphingobium sp. JCM 18896]